MKLLALFSCASVISAAPAHPVDDQIVTDFVDSYRVVGQLIINHMDHWKKLCKDLDQVTVLIKVWATWSHVEIIATW